MKNLLEKVSNVPKGVLERSVRIEHGIKENIIREEEAVKNYWKKLGPGLTTGAADDDPSGIATYSQAGANTGFRLIWLSLFSFPLMGAVQEMCARIGLATGMGLAANIKKNYSRKVLYISTFLLLIANTFNIGANLGAMAEGTRLIFPKLNFAFLVIAFAVISLLLQIFVSYKKYAKFLKYLALVLVAYIFSALSVNLDWGEILKHTFIPNITFSKDQIILICAILGTTISPYLFFWQTSQELEEQILKGETTEEEIRAKTTEDDIKNMRIDVWSGMFVSNLVMFFIIAACAATLYKSGITNIATAGQAAQALRPFAGEFAYVLFTVGIIGTGLLSIPVLAASASYAFAESFGWKFGLYRKLREAGAFYGVIIVSTFLGIVLNFVGLDPIKSLIYAAVLNGLISPVIMYLIVRVSSSEEIMGKYKNKTIGNVFGWLTVLIMTIVGITVIVSFLL